MNAQEAAILDLARLLAGAGIPYMLIGGHANAVWGEPRATLDVDVTIWTSEQQANDVLRILKPHFSCLVEDPESFVSDVRVLPLISDQGVRVDLIFGLLPFEEQAIRRARVVGLGGAEVRVCSPEDLILMKIISERQRDLDDARGVTLVRYADLDLAYLEPRIHELAELLEKPAILQHWATWKEVAERRR